ncbi:MAG: alpha/beta hydrolase [Polyangiaceae bacterium]
MTEPTQRVRVNGLEYALHRFGEPARDRFPERRTLLLLHGFLDAGATWDRVAPHLLAAGYDVVAPDLRGFGSTEWIGSGGYYHFPDYVADVEDLVASLAPAWLGVVGHSMGGGVAALYAGTRPDRVRKLAILEGLGPMDEPPALAVDRMRRWLEDRRRVVDRQPRPLGDLEAATDRLAASHPRLDRDLLRSRAALLTRALPSGELAWSWDPLHRTASPTPFSGRVFESFLRAITCPVLFVDGGPTGWHPPDEDERLATIAELTKRSLPDAGHMMHWSHPDELARFILEAFADAPAR